ncbi:phospholipid-transporting ATPase VD-like [Cololabis saira]|uniref:phospholipid-transporting ATPase VD-like n=1 Tax=Cololabis saira TaxID=129043 RepID=UPI002AD393CB|nr:phospholipid-transporting ATPase VD-like [Cololabis saira]
MAAPRVSSDGSKKRTQFGAEQSDVYNHVRDQTQNHLDTYAREGLRTLCIAKKVLDQDQYESWLKGQVLAESSIENRDELLLESAQRLETELTLLGSTGIVDRLQEDFPETIEALQGAGIRVWVLTGDKQETAVNVANACRLVRSDDRLLTLNCESKDACAALLEQLNLEVQRAEDGPGDPTGDGPGSVLVIDGRTLDWALQDGLQSSFLDLSRRCRAVICCRSTPLQKSQVVRLVRDRLGVLTLAVGDGANDVSMIQVAEVGVGISGQEGMQAVMASDFAVSRFRHLRKLVLVHGRWCYHRLANMILYFLSSAFSGSVMINSWVLILFNLAFTSVPPLVFGVLDQDTPAQTLLRVPELFLFRVLHRTLHPSAALRSAQRDEADSERYRRRMQRWNQKHPRTGRVPLCADNPGLEPGLEPGPDQVKQILQSRLSGGDSGDKKEKQMRRSR